MLTTVDKCLRTLLCWYSLGHKNNYVVYSNYFVWRKWNLDYALRCFNYTFYETVSWESKTDILGVYWESFLLACWMIKHHSTSIFLMLHNFFCTIKSTLWTCTFFMLFIASTDTFMRLWHLLKLLFLHRQVLKALM